MLNMDTQMRIAAGTLRKRTDETTYTATGNSIYAEVQFGQPSMRCRGAGICRVDLYNGMSRLGDQGNCARAIGVIEFHGNSLKLRFSKYSICKHLTEKYFAKGKIRLRESVMLSERLSQKLGRPMLVISAGDYGIEKEGHEYILTFSLPLQQAAVQKREALAAN